MSLSTSLVDPSSLAQTIALVEERFFWDKPVTPADSENVLKWLGERQGAKGAYGSMCAPTAEDMKGARLFTGERLGPGAQTRHMLGEEAYRAYLELSNGKASEVSDRMSEGMRATLDKHYDGHYCCGPCTVSVWRVLAAGGYENSNERLRQGMGYIQAKRDGKGRWKNLPFYYTLLTLTEMPAEIAKEELAYVGPTVASLLKRTPSTAEPYASRRKAILERAMSRYSASG